MASHDRPENQPLSSTPFPALHPRHPPKGHNSQHNSGLSLLKTVIPIIQIYEPAATCCRDGRRAAMGIVFRAEWAHERVVRAACRRSQCRRQAGRPRWLICLPGRHNSEESDRWPPLPKKDLDNGAKILCACTGIGQGKSLTCLSYHPSSFPAQAKMQPLRHPEKRAVEG